jgi:hypothetical protein
MTKTIAYNVGHSHGLRNLPASKMFQPETSFDAQQYKQGYTDGGVALQNDIAREKTLGKQTC